VLADSQRERSVGQVAVAILLNHVVGSGGHGQRYFEPERFAVLSFDDELELDRLYRSKSAGLSPLPPTRSG